MEFSLSNLQALLLKSKGLQLLPDDKREAYMQFVLNGASLAQKEKVFEILNGEYEEMVKIEEDFQIKMSAAVEKYVEDMQELQRHTLMELRIKKEKSSQKEDESHIEDLLQSLNTTS